MSEKSPNTERTIGLIGDTNSGWDADRFRLVRHKAKDEEEAIHRKARRDKKEKVPRYKVGDRVVITRDRAGRDRRYELVEVLDFENCGQWHPFRYYGVIIKISNEKSRERLGRMVLFREGSGWGFEPCPANTSEDGIRWLTSIAGGI